MAICIYRSRMSATIRPKLGRSTSCSSRSSCGIRKRRPQPRALGSDRVIGGVAAIASTIASPGVIKHTSQFASIRFGRADKKPDAKLSAFVEAGKAAKIDIALSDDIQRDLWQKFIFLTAMAGSTAGLRSPIGPIATDPELRGFVRALMEEAFAVGKAKGVPLDPAFIDDRMNFITTKIEPGMKASMAHDLERGNRLELDWLAGKVRALGREFGIATPASDTVYTALKLYRMGNKAA